MPNALMGYCTTTDLEEGDQEVRVEGSLVHLIHNHVAHTNELWVVD